MPEVEWLLRWPWVGVGVALLLEVGPSVEVGMVLPSHWLFGVGMD